MGACPGYSTATSRTGAATDEDYYTAAMSLEALRTQMDTLKREMGQLEIENLRLRDSNPDQERLLELEAELEQSKEEISHLTERLEDVPRLEQNYLKFMNCKVMQVYY